MKYILARQATLDIKNIEHYIAYELASPQASKNIINGLFSAADAIAFCPGIGPLLSNYYKIHPKYATYQFWTVGNYKLFYNVEDNSTVVIYRVFNTRQNYISYFNAP